MNNKKILQIMYNMKKNNNFLQHRKNNALIDDVICFLEDREIKNTTITHIRAYSQRGKILSFLQENPSKNVYGILFNKKQEIGGAPFIGYSASARLTELYRAGLLNKIGVIKGKQKRTSDMNIYNITKKGLEFNIT